MNTKQIALDALKIATLQNGCDMLLTGAELRKCESAIAALKADLVQPQAATINSELLAIVVDICGPGSAYACNCGEVGCRTTIARAAIAKATGAQS